MRFTEDTLQEQLRMALFHAEECFDRYIMCEALSFDAILVKMREWTIVERLYRLGAMCDSTQLTPDRKSVMASIINIHSLATCEVMFHLQRKDAAGCYAFQRAIMRPPRCAVVGQPQVVGAGQAEPEPPQPQVAEVAVPAAQQTCDVSGAACCAAPPPCAGSTTG